MQVRSATVSSIPAVMKAYPHLTTPYSYLIHCLKTKTLMSWGGLLKKEPFDAVNEYEFSGNFLDVSNAFMVRIGKDEMQSSKARHFLRVWRKAVARRYSKANMKRFGQQ